MTKPNPRLLYLGHFLVWFLFYASAVPKANVGFGDSDMLITLGYLGGVAHPPGYPLYLLLLYLTTHTPLPFPPVQSAHLLSALLSALTLTLMLTAVQKFLTKVPSPSRFRWPFSIIAVMALGLMIPYWQMSLVAEKTALNLLLASLIIFQSFKLTSPSPSSSLSQSFYFFIIGLALSTHLSLWFLLPLVFTTLWLIRSVLTPKKCLWGVLWFSAGFLITLTSLWLLNRHSAPVSWHFSPTFTGLIRHALMLDFLSPILGSGPVTEIGTAGQQLSDLSSRSQAFLPYIQYLSQALGYIFLSLGGLGSGLLLKSKSILKPPQKYLLLNLSLPSLILIPLLIPFPAGLAGQAIVTRHYLLGFLSLPFLISLGLVFLGRHLKPGWLVAILVPLLLWRLISLYPQLDLSQDTAFAQSYRDILISLPPDSLLACQSDVACFALIYEQQVNRLRPDVVLVPEAYQFLSGSLATRPDLKGYNFPVNPFVMLDYLSWNQGKRPVYLLDLQPSYFKYLGIDRGIFHLEPQGYVSRLSSHPATPAASPAYPYTQTLLQTRYHQADLFRLQRLAGTAQRHLLNARVLPQEISLAQALFSRLPSPPPASAITPPPPDPMPPSSFQTALDQFLLHPRDLESKRNLAEMFTKMHSPELSSALNSPF